MVIGHWYMVNVTCYLLTKNPGVITGIYFTFGNNVY
jgi:hypothetical protein